MRLTIKDKIIRDTFNAEYAKLADLEDIEEELGIDLITLFKALKNNKVWVRTLKNNFHKSIECREGVRIESFFWLNVKNSDGHWVDYRIKDYGKTWALTKEELL